MKAKVTVKDVVRWRPCRDYCTSSDRPSRAKIRAGFGGRDSVTPLEICDLKISVVDRLWLLLWGDVFDKNTLCLLSCKFSEHFRPILKRVTGAELLSAEKTEMKWQLAAMRKEIRKQMKDAA